MPTPTNSHWRKGVIDRREKLFARDCRIDPDGVYVVYGKEEGSHDFARVSWDDLDRYLVLYHAGAEGEQRVRSVSDAGDVAKLSSLAHSDMLILDLDDAQGAATP